MTLSHNRRKKRLRKLKQIIKRIKAEDTESRTPDEFYEKHKDRIKKEISE